MNILAFILLVLLTNHSFAEISVTTSDFSTTTSNSSVTSSLVSIWGGVSGDAANSTNAVVNSCNLNTGDKLADCNFRQIGQNVTFSITFSSDEEFSGNAFIKNSSGVAITASNPSYSTGQSVTITTNWTNFCSEMTGNDPTCAASGTADFTFGVEESSASENRDSFSLKVYLIANKVAQDCNNFNPGDGIFDVGIKDYSAYMGDEKVYFPNSSTNKVAVPIQLCADDNESLPSGGDITKLVAFYNQTSLATVNTDSDKQYLDFEGDYPDNTSDSAPELNPGYIDGFANESRVYTRLAVQDEAGNILGVTPSAAQVTADPICNTVNNSSPIADIFACKYSTVPLEVAGLLADDVNCFIATATFGSSMHSTVRDFRAFRSQILLKTKWGVWLVKKYYKWGSYLSHYIVKSPALKKLSRVALQPAWLFAVVSLKLGLGTTALLTILFGAALFFTTKKLLKYKKGAFS